MRSYSCRLSLAVVTLLSLVVVAIAQDAFTGSRGFAPTFKTSADTPAASADLSIQVPGNVELNGCIRWTDASGQNCLCRDLSTDQVWSEIDCDGVYEGAPDEFYLGTWSGGTGKVITDADSEVDGLVVGNGTNRMILWCDESACTFKCLLDDQPCPPDIVIPSGHPLRFLAGASPFLTLNPEAGSRNQMWAIGTGFYTLVSSEVPLHPIEGTDAAFVREAIVTDDPADDWLTFADAVGDGFDFSFVITQKITVNTTVKATFMAVNINASPSGTFTLQCAGRSVRPGADVFAAHSTTGSGNASFTTWGAQYRPQVASAVFTLNGTVAVNAIIKNRCTVTAAPAQIDDIRVRALGVVELSGNSLSD